MSPKIRRAIRWGVAGVGALTLLTGGFVGVNVALLGTDRPVGHWRADEARADYEQLYDDAMKLLPTPTSSRDLETGFGTVRAYTFGPADEESAGRGGAPLLLLPGFGGPASTWYASVGDLAKDRTVIVIDALGMPGASVQDRPITSGRDQAAWLHDTIEALGLDRVHLVGFSFGGLQAATFAASYPDRVASLSLLEPAYVFAPVNPSFLVGGFLASFPLLPDACARSYTGWISGGSDASRRSPLAPLLDHGRKHFATVLPTPQQLTPTQLSQIEAPTSVVLAGNSVAHDAAEAQQAAAAAISDLTIRIEPDASHALHIEHHATLNREILEFSARHDA